MVNQYREYIKLNSQFSFTPPRINHYLLKVVISTLPSDDDTDLKTVDAELQIGGMLRAKKTFVNKRGCSKVNLILLERSLLWLPIVYLSFHKVVFFLRIDAVSKSTGALLPGVMVNIDVSSISSEFPFCQTYHPGDLSVPWIDAHNPLFIRSGTCGFLYI